MDQTQKQSLLQQIVRLNPVRRAISSIGNTDSGIRFLNFLNGKKVLFKSFGEAKAVADSLKAKGHEAEFLSELPLLYPIRTSDYPPLYWLNRIRPKVLFDLGGSVGNLYYLYQDYLDSKPSWIVYDLPEIVERGKALAIDRNTQNLSFSTNLSAGKDCDVLLASGSLQFWEESMAWLLNAMGSKPRHIIINRTLLTEQKPSFVILQYIADAALPKMIRNRGELIAELESLGYECTGEWLEPGRELELTLFPAHSVRHFSGLYFRLRQQPD
jgi:putative methyltransferase (TIGR04325 family)